MNIESAMAGDAVQSEIAAAVEQATGDVEKSTNVNLVFSLCCPNILSLKLR